MPLIMKRCMDGRGTIGTALAYIGTQQPFPYVHLLAVLTDLALAVNAMCVARHTSPPSPVPRPLALAAPPHPCRTFWSYRYVGLHTGRQLFVSRHCEAAQGGAACETPWQSESHLNVLLLVGFAGVRVAAFTLIYNGLLGIGVSLDNPIGDGALLGRGATPGARRAQRRPRHSLARRAWRLQTRPTCRGSPSKSS